MKERPIIFSGDMMRAILEGRKVQTRRIMKPQPVLLDQYQNGERILEWKEKGILQASESAAAIILESPFGGPGDILWVRETWGKLWRNGEYCIQGDEKPIKCADCRDCKIEYKADTNDKYPGGWPEEYAKGNDESPKWRPSIHMPRWASRIDLLVKRVWVHRIQEISEEDAKAEGIVSNPNWARGTRKERFEFLWNSLYPSSWERNDWVFACEFERMDK